MSLDIYIFAEIKNNSIFKMSKIEIPRDRCYCAFDIMANTMRSNCNVIPISDPRGIPKDVSTEILKKLHDDKLGDHSYSYLYLYELLALDLDSVIEEQIMVKNQEAQTYRETGKIPKHYCSWTNDKEYEIITIKKSLKKAAWLIPKIIKKLNTIGNSNDIRIVFGFMD